MRKTSIKSADREKSAASEKQQLKDWAKKQRLEREAFREWLAHKDEFKGWLRNIKNGEDTFENATKLLNGALKRPVKQGNVSVSKSFGEAALKIIDDIEADTECALMFSTLLVSRNVKLPDVSLSNDRSDHTPKTEDIKPPRWFDRRQGINAAQFIRENYGELDGETWRNRGVTRPDLKKNPGLYNAYTAWIGDHPEDTLEFALGGGKPSGRPRKSDTYEKTLERDRERKRNERQPDAPK